MGYNSKYTGEQVEERLDRVDEIPEKVSELDNDVGYMTEKNADNAYAPIEVLGDVKSLSATIVVLNKKIDELENNEIVWEEVQ